MQLWKKTGLNKIVFTMISSDFLVVSAPGFVSPIVAVFLTTQVQGATLATVGFATTLFWVVKSAVQVPVSAYIDARRGERDDFAIMVIGTTIVSIVPLLYYFFAHEVWQVYLFETINGIGYAMQVPTWLAIFTRHIDRHREGTEWMFHSNAIGLGYAGTAALGGVLAERFGFRVIFLLVSAFLFLGSAALLAMRDEIAASDAKDGASAALAEEREKKII